MNQSNFLPDGPWQMESHPDHQRKLAELRASIEAKYQAELKSASFFRRWIVRRKMNSEIAAERKKMGPSNYAM